MLSQPSWSEQEIEILFSWAKIHITASQSLMPLNPAAKLMGKMRAAAWGATTKEKNLSGEVAPCDVCERAAESERDLWENARLGERGLQPRKKSYGVCGERKTARLRWSTGRPTLDKNPRDPHNYSQKLHKILKKMKKTGISACFLYNYIDFSV